VLTALSDEDGENFGSPERVVDNPEPGEGATMFRDPFVWKDAGCWEMAVGAAEADQTASIRHYRSEDGIKWRRVEDLASLKRTFLDGNDTGEGWECPQIFHVDGRSVAIVSSWSHGDGPAHVLAFPIEDPSKSQRVDDGTNFYAASVMRHGTHGPLLFGWIREGRTEEWWRAAGWAGAISLPKTVWLNADGALGSAPHPALSGLRAGESRSAPGASLGAQAELFIPSVSGVTRIRFGKTESIRS
jgi:beta-fructofuranosidase